MSSKNEEYNNFEPDNDFLLDDKCEKKIYPVYNENNFYITKEIIQSILLKCNIKNEINSFYRSNIIEQKSYEKYN